MSHVPENRWRAPEEPLPELLPPMRPLDPTPPEDHDEFVELRSRGLRAIRAQLEKRRKR
ncbi:MAG TPA: hypothetical protein VHG91_01415 [Longimicrobium sp.]|nr:hypothetical protein [Longimicrobium sp.]